MVSEDEMEAAAETWNKGLDPSSLAASKQHPMYVKKTAIR